MDPFDARADLEETIALVAKEAARYLEGLDDRPVRDPDADDHLKAFEGSLPERGEGTLAPLRDLLTHGIAAATHSAGPRFFHFVIGGVTPAALGADWITSLIDQNAGLWDASPLGSSLESLTIGWLLDLFELPSGWTGALTKSATLANFAALGCARAWWADRHGVDVNEEGFVGLPRVPVFSSGYIHASARKSIAMLGIGRGSVKTFAADGTGRLDVDGMRAALEALDGAPAIIVGNAGEVNAGDFDPLDAMADLAERYNAWLHVDGAFGLFTRLAPEARGLSAGIERADSVIADGHKWLNVPYDCGIAFLKDPSWMLKTYALPGAAYLPGLDDPHPNYGFNMPDSSRRARALAVYATLRAYGRDGHRAYVERHLALTRHLGARVEAEPDFELLAPVVSNIACFRYRPAGLDEQALNTLNARLGKAVLEDGRVFVGTTTFDGRTAFRPAIVNYRTTEQHVDELVDVIAELGAQLV
jgi:glutamate/tyrosine decarboxylase-like PLP-dependent enzyme